MEREYIIGNNKHWKDICKYVYGYIPKPYIDYSYCGDDKIIFVKNDAGKFNIFSDPVIREAIITNPNWHEIKPWEDNYNPKPFDKVLGWDEDENTAKPDIFLFKYNDGYFACARYRYQHIKLYNEEEYLKSLTNDRK